MTANSENREAVARKQQQLHGCDYGCGNRHHETETGGTQMNTLAQQKQRREDDTLVPNGVVICSSRNTFTISSTIQMNNNGDGKKWSTTADTNLTDQCSMNGCYVNTKLNFPYIYNDTKQSLFVNFCVNNNNRIDSKSIAQVFFSGTCQHTVHIANIVDGNYHWVWHVTMSSRKK